MDGDKVSTTTGADGSIMHNIHASYTGTITVRLLKTSPVNALLDQLYNFQSDNPGNAGQNTIQVTDVQRGDVISGSLMAFVKRPDLTYAVEGGMNEWVFRGVVREFLGAGTPNLSI